MHCARSCLPPGVLFGPLAVLHSALNVLALALWSLRLSLPLLLLLFKECRGLFFPGSPPLTAHFGLRINQVVKDQGGNGVTGSEEGCCKVMNAFLVEGFFYRCYTRQQFGV